MKTYFTGWFGSLRALLLSILLCITAAHARDPWGLQPQATKQEISHVLDLIGHASVAVPGDLDRELLALNFKPDIAKRDWLSMTEHDKLTIAYRWASAVSEDNGRWFLARLSHQFAEHYESLGFNPVFRNLDRQLQERTGKTAAEFTTIAFRKPTMSQLAALLPADVTILITHLALYVDGPGPLGKYTLAAHVFDLEGEKLERAMEKHDSVTFLKNASQQAPKPPPIHERLNLLIKKVMLYSEAAGHDTALAQAAARLQQEFGKPPITLTHADTLSAKQTATILPGSALPDKPTWAGTLPAQSDAPLLPSMPGSASGTGGRAPARIVEATATHQHFMNRFYSSSASRTHAAVMQRAGGGGGVIAGASVTSTIGKPLQIATDMAPYTVCDASGTQAKGMVSVRTSKGSYTYPNVRCDVMLAVRNIVYGVNGINGWQPGDAIILATIDTAGLYRTYPAYAPADGNPLKLGRRHRMLLHPALIDLDIGRAVALLDLWPSASQLIFRATNEDKKVAHWLSTRHAVTWKWSDSPTIVSAIGTTISITPAHRTNMLSLREFSEHEVTQERLQELFGTLPGNHGRLSITFDEAMPVLMRHIPDFSRAEELLTVLALFRWARQEGAILGNTTIRLRSPRPMTPDTIIVGFLKDSLSGAPASASWAAECAVVAARLKEMKKVNYKPGDRRQYAIEEAEKLVAAAATNTGDRCQR